MMGGGFSFSTSVVGRVSDSTSLCPPCLLLELREVSFQPLSPLEGGIEFVVDGFLGQKLLR